MRRSFSGLWRSHPKHLPAISPKTTSGVVGWDPSQKKNVPLQTDGRNQVSVTVYLPEQAVAVVQGGVGASLLEVLERSDMGDVWQGGQCGGACSCSTCRVVVVAAPSVLNARGDDELDMLDTAAAAAERLGKSGWARWQAHGCSMTLLGETRVYFLLIICTHMFLCRQP